MSFGPFRLLTRQRLLLEAGKPIPVGSRALDLLIALLERPGELLTKEELIARAWPSTHVVESNLKFQVAALRRALRDGQDGRRFLQTTSGRGYRFVADVAVEADAAPPRTDPAPATSKHNLPARLTPLVGRADHVAKLAARLKAQRLVTIVGPGGIGKTSVAIAAAEQSTGMYEDGTWSVDFGRLTDPASVQSAVAAAVRVNVDPEDPLESLVAALGHARMLLVLDRCSHVIDAVARLVVAILNDAPGVHVLATSREPLRVEGEHVYRLGPLETPPAADRLTAVEALQYPAVQLFAERAGASDDGFEIKDEDAHLVAEVCRKLDGIPLAIELAAARVDVLGLRGLAAGLEHGLQVLTGGHRTALPAHRTMRAALDWSHGLLSATEQAVFARLAVFAGGFTFAAAAAVASDASHSAEEIVSLVLDLATKSLVAADVDIREPRFRLLETTRAYALEKARERGELESLARRHASYFLNLFAAVARDDAAFAGASVALALEVNNLRAALAWAFAPAGDPAIGIGLVSASVPLWLSMSALGEWHAWAEKAVRGLDEAGLRGTPQEMMIEATLGMSYQLVRNRASEAHAALTRALELAEHLGDIDYQLRILHTLWIYETRTGDLRTAMALARRADAVAASLAVPIALATAAWMLGISLHWGGDHAAARRHLEHLLEYVPAVGANDFLHRFGFDLYVVARYIVARTLWLQGWPDQASVALQASIDEARRLQHSGSLCSALAFGGCSHSLHIGDLDAAGRLAVELVACAQRHSMADYVAYGQAVQEILALRQGGRSGGTEQFRLALLRWRGSRWHVLLSSSDFAEAAADAGFHGEITALVDEELAWAESNAALYTVPEALRVKGELLLLRTEPDLEGAKECFLRALDCARAQGALSWELRAATSLARLERTQGRPGEARQLLQAVYGRFTEGFGSPDLQRAKQLLGELDAALGPQAGGGKARAHARQASLTTPNGN